MPMVIYIGTQVYMTWVPIYTFIGTQVILKKCFTLVLKNNETKRKSIHLGLRIADNYFDKISSYNRDLNFFSLPFDLKCNGSIFF